MDIGSTTMKCVLIDENEKLLFSKYIRHQAKIAQTAVEILGEAEKYCRGEKVGVSMSGSAGMGVSEKLDIPFVQEVFAEKIAVNALNPGTDAVIELGGEDAKILFLTGGFEMRMNGTCAGGTGAFLDQMASLMKVTPSEMNELAKSHENTCVIASRCGVFAKSDIQPLLNQGTRREDISAGIFKAVVNQTIAGLAQGRSIKGKILYLGGPLTFLSELRSSFDESLGTKGICPENSLYYVALGAAYSDVYREMSLDELCGLFSKSPSASGYVHSAPLFKNKDEYELFKLRHQKASDGIKEIDRPNGPMCLGVDAGSTTVKILLIDKEGNIFRPFYASNDGDPVTAVKNYLNDIYRDFPDIEIASSASTGYGEELVKNAFGLDFGIIETVAHFTAAKKFRPDVDFILDIGGQDIKCFHIRNGAIDNIYLNEACSSGCGSFLQTFASALGYTSEQFAKLGLFADAPVSLGSRCTVFMNSAVKQAQKDGASVENIAAGLSVSVVKNALYKVIRCSSADSLGKNIVVQGGTFLNDCVLRAFEQEIGREVIRPKYAPIMGAYGAALYAMNNASGKSSVLNSRQMAEFKHEVRSVKCGKCTNNCTLTVNSFGNGRKYIAGNRCSRPVSGGKLREKLDIYEYKLSLLKKYSDKEFESDKKTVGLPLGLNMYELLPFWSTFFRKLGFNVLVSPLSDRKIYLEGQHTIPSDTACYPAKIMHGHIEWLLKNDPDVIFYPDMSYNVEEGLGVNHFNCPVVAYYPQVIKDNVSELSKTVYICDFMSLANPKQFEKRIFDVITKYFPNITKKEIKSACKAAYEEYGKYLENIREKGKEIIETAKQKGMPIIVLAGRPYHLDPEINHGIDNLLCELGAAVISEDSVSGAVDPFPVDVRNQWTYHARLYAAAKFVGEADKKTDINLVQLVSFGCGVDAVTTDEVRFILEKNGKLYTQLKIDEISNMGAATIRLRSLFAIDGEKRKNNG